MGGRTRTLELLVGHAEHLLTRLFRAHSAGLARSVRGFKVMVGTAKSCKAGRPFGVRAKPQLEAEGL